MRTSVKIPVKSQPGEKGFTLEEAFPNIANLIHGGGSIELGYEYNTQSFARALEPGGGMWTGGTEAMGIDELLDALEVGIAESDWGDYLNDD